MKTSSPKYEISLYLRGTDLNPLHVSNILGIEATRSHSKGHKSITSKGREIIAKTGLWGLSAEGDTNDIAALFSDLLSKIEPGISQLANAQKVEEAYVDVFATLDAEDDGGGTFEIELGVDELGGLSRLKIPVRLTLAVVRK